MTDYKWKVTWKESDHPRDSIGRFADKGKLGIVVRFKYNPTQERMPAGSPDGGQWTSGGGGSLSSGQFYHGGNLSDLDKIIAQGLKPSKQRHFGRPPSVYVTENEDVAHQYGLAWTRPGGKYAIFEIEIPGEEFGNFKKDEHERDSFYWPHGKIPAGWIRGYKIYQRPGPQDANIDEVKLIDEWSRKSAKEKEVFCPYIIKGD